MSRESNNPSMANRRADQPEDMDGQSLPETTQTTPLTSLMQTAGFMLGEKNELFNFEVNLKETLGKLDQQYRDLLDKKQRLKSFDSKVDPIKQSNHPLVLKLEIVEELLKEMRKELREKVSPILTAEFKRAFAFVIETLDDEKLQKHGIAVDQKTIANYLYSLLTHYESFYILGRQVRVDVTKFVKEKALEKGERILKNVLPENEDPRAAKKSPISSTLAPPAFVALNEEAIREGAQRMIAGSSLNQLFENVSTGYDNSWQSSIGEQRGEVEVAVKEAVTMPAPPVKEDDSPEIVMGETLILRSLLDDSDDEDDKTEPDLVLPSFSTTDHFEVRYSSPPKHPPRPLGNTAEKNLPSIIVSPEVLSDSEKMRAAEKAAAEVKAEEPPVTKNEKPTHVQFYEKNLSPESIKAPIPPQKSWYENIKEKAGKAVTFVNEKISAAWDSTKKFVVRNLKPVAVATGLVLAASSGMAIKQAVQNNSTTGDSETLTSPTASASASSSSKKTDVAPVDTVTQPKVVTPIEVKKDVEKAPTTRKFAKVLSESTSPIVQSILNKGEAKLGMNSVTDTMISSFMSLANAEQNKELHELQQRVNLALGVYFNEHFGTPAKVAASLKDPKMKNLYRTAKHAQEKGWFSSIHTKEKFPQAYQLAVKMLADSSDLGLDSSDSTDQNVKDFVAGNMFQAKRPGDNLKLRKADGNYHIVQEMVLEIFEGKKVSDLMEVRFGKGAAGGEGGKGGVEQKDNGTPTDGGKLEKAPGGGFNQHDDSWQDGHGESGEGKTGMNVPSMSDQMMARTEQKLIADVDAGWDEIAIEQDKLIAAKKHFEKSQEIKFELPLSYTTRQENEAILPSAIEKLASMYPEHGTEVKKLLRQWGFIGMSLVSRERGQFTVKLNKKFHAILDNEVLKKSAKSA